MYGHLKATIQMPCVIIVTNWIICMFASFVIGVGTGMFSVVHWWYAAYITRCTNKLRAMTYHTSPS